MRSVSSRLVLVLACGCGGAGTRPAAPLPAPTEHRAEEPVAPDNAPPGSIGSSESASRQRTSHRQTFVLSFDHEHVTLVETDEVGDSPTIAIADHEPHWSVAAAHTYTGLRHGDDLDLSTPDMQELHLHCVPTSVEVAAAGARRVESRQPVSDHDCGDHGVWDPPAMQHVEALVCSAAGQTDDANTDDDDRLVFGVAPGIELAYENDGCAMAGGGLRRAL